MYNESSAMNGNEVSRGIIEGNHADYALVFTNTYGFTQRAVRDDSPQSKWGTEAEIESEFDALLSQIQ